MDLSLLPWILWAATAAVALFALLKWVGVRRELAAEESLRANQERRLALLESVLEEVPLGWFDIRSPGEVGTGRLSERGAKMLCLEDAANPIGLEQLLAQLADESRAGAAAAIQELCETDKDFDLEARLHEGRGQVSLSGRQAPDGGARVWIQDQSALVLKLEEVQRRYTRLRESLDNLPIPLWSRDGEKGLTDCNRAYAEALESTREAVLEAGLELLGQSRLEEAVQLSKKAREAEEGQASLETHVVIRGARRFLRMTERRLQGQRLLGYAEDETEQEELRREIQRHLEAQHEVLENLGTAMVIFGADLHADFFNSAYLQLFGLDEGKMRAGRHLGDVLEDLRERRRLPEQPNFPAYKQDLIKSYSTLFEPMEELLHLPDGTTLRKFAFPYPLGGVLLSFEDVTDRLAMERNYNTLIAVQSETLDKLYEGVAVYGADGRLQLFNPGFAKVWNLSPDWLESKPHVRDIMQRSRAFFGIYDDEAWHRYLEHCVSATTDLRLRNGRRERIDGSVIDWAQVPLPDGQVLYTFVDVTDSILVERALMERNEALETADRLKSEFIANVSYELRTPLNAIIGFAEILGNQFFGPLNERQIEYSNAIVEASQRLITLINDILDLASIEAGYLHIDLEVVDLVALLEGVHTLGHERARSRQLELTLDCPEDLGTIEGDSRRLKQALFNLVSNALKYTPEGGAVTISGRRDDETVSLTVADTGVGINEEDQARVFDSFERGRHRSGQGGAGLGLSLVRSLVELHGGKVELHSEVNGGTRVTCAIPIVGPLSGSGALEAEG